MKNLNKIYFKKGGGYEVVEGYGGGNGGYGGQEPHGGDVAIAMALAANKGGYSHGGAYGGGQMIGGGGGHGGYGGGYRSSKGLPSASYGSKEATSYDGGYAKEGYSKEEYPSSSGYEKEDDYKK